MHSFSFSWAGCPKGRFSSGKNGVCWLIGLFGRGNRPIRLSVCVVSVGRRRFRRSHQEKRILKKLRKRKRKATVQSRNSLLFPGYGYGDTTNNNPRADPLHPSASRRAEVLPSTSALRGHSTRSAKSNSPSAVLIAANPVDCAAPSLEKW